MKKSFLVIALMLIASITMTTNSAQACPDGYDLHTAQMFIDGCLYDVDMCYKCGVGPVPGEMQIQEIRKLDPNCNQTLNLQQLQDAAEAQFCNFDYISTILCLNWAIPDCDNGTRDFKINHWVCWEAEWIQYFGEQFVVYRPCDYGARCVEEITVCYDAVNDVYVRTATKPPYLVDGPINCTLEAWQVMEPTQLGQITPCYVLHTDCNP